MVTHLEGLTGKFCLVIAIAVSVNSAREAEMVSVKQRRKKAAGSSEKEH